MSVEEAWSIIEKWINYEDYAFDGYHIRDNTEAKEALKVIEEAYKTK